MPPEFAEPRPRSLASLADVELVGAITNAQRGALVEVHRRYAASVHRVARQICGADADDVVQEVFIRLWQRPERFDEQRGALRSFLLRIAHDRAVDVTRSSSARRTREARDAARVVPGEELIDRQAVANVEAEFLRALLLRLPKLEGEAIQLAYLGGNTYKAVAELLGEAEGTVKTRVRTGLARLASWLREEEDLTPASHSRLPTAATG